MAAVQRKRHLPGKAKNFPGGGNHEVTAKKEEKTPQKNTRQIVEELIKQGLSNKEIAEKTGIKYPTVYSHAKVIREQLEKAQTVSSAGHNADRHLCKTCQYRAPEQAKNLCDYISIVGSSRGCKAEDCNVYVKGERLKIKGE